MLSCEVKSQLDFRIAGLDAERDLRAEMREIVQRARAMRNDRVKREHDRQAPGGGGVPPRFGVASFPHTPPHKFE